jgi:hypothetical protein
LRYDSAARIEPGRYGCGRVAAAIDTLRGWLA